MNVPRIMAIDWGERRVGIALSDESCTIASPHSVLERSRSLDRDIDRLAGLVEECDVRLVLVGLPLRLDGTQGPAAEVILQVTERLRAVLQVPVQTCDERLSTAEAERALIGGDVSRKRRKGLVDQVAAALFLQTYLDSASGGAR